MNARRFVAAFGIVMTAASPLRAQVPDVRQMSGIPMPAGDVPTGSVIVRVVGASVADNLVGKPVDLQMGDRTQTVKTNANGHAQFDGLPPSAMAKVSVTVDGRRIESQPFQILASGGTRVILATADPGGSPPGDRTAAGPGGVFLGGDSRIQIEFDDDALTLFYLFEIVNAGSSPVSPAAELVFDLPEDAEQPTLLEGSSTQASIRGRRVSIAGPFAPGSTPVQLAFGLPAGPADRLLSQTLPIAWARVQVLVTRLPGLSMTSAQFATSGEVAGGAHGLIVGSGAGLEAGKPLTVALTGVPSRGRTARRVAVVLASLVLLAGIWGAATANARTGDLARKAELDERRNRLMADLIRLENQRFARTVEAGRYASRRSALIEQLERVYGELDQHGGSPGEGLPA